MSDLVTFTELRPALRVAAVEEIRKPLWAGLVDAGHVVEHPLSQKSIDWLKRMKRAAVEDGYVDEFLRLDERCDRYLRTLPRPSSHLAADLDPLLPHSQADAPGSNLGGILHAGRRAARLGVARVRRPPAEGFRAQYPAGFELRQDGASGTDGKRLVGHFARFGEWAEIHSIHEGHFLERLSPGAFRKTIAENRGRIRALFQHGKDPVVADKPLGPIEVRAKTPRAPTTRFPCSTPPTTPT